MLVIKCNHTPCRTVSFMYENRQPMKPTTCWNPLIFCKLVKETRLSGGRRVFNATYNISVISWRSVLLMEDTEVNGENHRPVESHWQTLSLYVISSTPRHERIRTRRPRKCTVFLLIKAPLLINAPPPLFRPIEHFDF